MIFSELTGREPREFFERGGKMLGRIEAGVQRYICYTDIRPLQQFDGFGNTDIDQVIDGRKAGIAFYTLCE